jgi:transcriptional regulator with XRE-family HTH domain
LEEVLVAIVDAIRERVKAGRTHGEVAMELGVERSMISRIIRGERGIGMRTFHSIRRADAPWLRSVLAGAPASMRGSNGKGPKGQAR